MSLSPVVVGRCFLLRQWSRRQLTVIVRSQARKAPGRPLCWNSGSLRTTTVITSCTRSSESCDQPSCRCSQTRMSGS